MDHRASAGSICPHAHLSRICRGRGMSMGQFTWRIKHSHSAHYGMVSP
ncbi:hypothetical protein I547_2565 [Mycobacterium kansasii 824]|nr:hypothetical protein I547_2565 [Mycobacterium kansasii 824]